MTEAVYTATAEYIVEMEQRPVQQSILWKWSSGR